MDSARTRAARVVFAARWESRVRTMGRMYGPAACAFGGALKPPVRFGWDAVSGFEGPRDDDCDSH
jgi:hypothetical protein